MLMQTSDPPLASTAAVACLAFVVAFVVSRCLKIGRREALLPPGPPTLPLLGNLHIFPKVFPHYKLTEWAREYGEIYSLKMGSEVVIVLSSAAVVKELLDKRSGTTIDRTPHHMAERITGGLNLVFARYSSTWRVMRKAVHSMLTPQVSSKYVPVQRAESLQLMHDIHKEPERFFRHICRFSNSVVLSILYGKRSPRYETHESAAFFEVMHKWNLAFDRRAHPPMDLIPALKYVPEFLAPWKKLCKDVRRMQRALYFGLLEESETRAKEDKAHDNIFMDKLVCRQGELGITREMAGYIGGVLIEGGSETTSTFIQSLLLCLTAFPEAQEAAQREMDAVVGSQRMPTPEDAVSLKYLNAVIKEVHRFRPVVPLVAPHRTLSDEVYSGYVIPKGADIFLNVWGICHDPDSFDDPEVFRPERYLESEFGTKKGVDDSAFRHTLPFGAGRRICPGIHMANNSLIVSAMNLVWTFNFFPQVDDVTGKPIKPDVWAYEQGLLPQPKPFKCNIQPRSDGRAAMMEAEFANVIPFFEPYEERLRTEDKEWLRQFRLA